MNSDRLRGDRDRAEPRSARLEDYVQHTDDCELSRRNIWHCPQCQRPTTWDYCQACGEGSQATWCCTCGLAALLTAPQPQVEQQASGGCIACGETNDGGYMVEDGPGPFCSECWSRLEDEFAKPDPATAPPEGWQPLSTAPKDGTPVLVFDDGAFVIAAWVNGDDIDEPSGWYDNGIMKPPPTHWMQLPKGPDA